VTVAVPQQAATGARFVGVDITRGTALLGMMAVHSFSILDGRGDPTTTTIVAGGRSAAAFAFVAGVSLAFLSGGKNVLRGHQRQAAAAGIAVRGVLIAVIGLLLEYLDTVEVILAFYGLMFLLVIPLLGLRTRALALVAAVVAVLGPVLLVATARRDLAGESDEGFVPTLGMLLTDPAGLLTVLFITGTYPIVTYLSFVCAGMAVGRLDLSSRRVALWLLGGGLTTAVLAKLWSTFLLYQLGGLERLIQAGADGDDGAVSKQELLWSPDQGSSWWYLALSSPHSHTPLDVLHTSGTAMAVLGAALLLARLPVATRVLYPVAAAGTMTLTLYSGHLVILATGVLDDEPTALYLLMIVVATSFAVVWRRRYGQGPLERLVAMAAGRARRLVAERPEPPSVSAGTTDPSENGSTELKRPPTPSGDTGP
jgi:uncharacterized membrane protein